MTGATVFERDYHSLARSLRIDPELSRDERMQRVVDGLWPALAPSGVSWLGFYIAEKDKPEMVLGPRRDKPACSPIGLHGACGRCLLSRRPLIVRDVASLGAGYIACDPRDRSEVVVPLISARGDCWGVMDLDSYDVGSFDEADVAGLGQVLAAAGLVPDAPHGFAGATEVV